MAHTRTLIVQAQAAVSEALDLHSTGCIRDVGQAALFKLAMVSLTAARLPPSQRPLDAIHAAFATAMPRADA